MTSSKPVVQFGIIGCGLMGREFASAAARWSHLTETKARPEIIAICDTNADLYPWYQDNFPSIRQATADYRALLANPQVDAVYCALPHHLHQEIYIEAIRAGKPLLGEKPFGIDLRANRAIMKEIAQHPETLVRCSSEFPFYPGAQRIIQAVENNDLGDIIEVEAGLLHSSDINPHKPINWKRQVASNGEYGCMGDLGMHVFHVPLRLGWRPQSVYAQLSNLVTERPDEKGRNVPCETWDNATLHCQVAWNNQTFPMSCKTWRIAPGETDTWYLRVLGTRKSLVFSTKQPRTWLTMDYEPGGNQTWHSEDLGYTPLFPAITAGIFEFGFTDAVLQMWGAFIDELAGGDAKGFPCVYPEETYWSHCVFTAALASHANQTVQVINYPQL